jgi:hypothetical protein
VPYEISLPDLGAPDEVYLRSLPDGNQMVSLVFVPRDGLPETEGTGVGLLLMQFEARTDAEYIAKNVAEGTGVFPVSIGPYAGLWVPGSHSLTLLSDPSQSCCPPARQSGAVLLWEQGGVTFRMESDLPRAAAIAIAEAISGDDATPTP